MRAFQDWAQAAWSGRSGFVPFKAPHLDPTSIAWRTMEQRVTSWETQGRSSCLLVWTRRLYCQDYSFQLTLPLPMSFQSRPIPGRRQCFED